MNSYWQGKGRGEKIAVKFDKPLVGDVTGFIPEPLSGVMVRPVGVATASGQYSSSYTPDKAFDDSTSSCWYIRTTGDQWIQIELNDAVRTNGFQWYVSSYRPNGFTVQGSNDGETWTTILTDNSPDSAGWQSFEWDWTIAYKFYRWTVTSRYSNYLYIYEIQLSVGKGNESAFTVTGTEKVPLKIGELQEREYAVESVERYPILEYWQDEFTPIEECWRDDEWDGDMDGVDVSGKRIGLDVEIGGALEFDGGAGYVDCGVGFSITNSLTIEAWIKVSNYTAFPRIAGVEAAWVSYITDYSRGHKLSWYGSNVDTPFPDSPNLLDGVFHHIAITYAGNGIKGYVDGIFVGELSKTGNLNSIGSTSLAIGNRVAGDRAFDGVIDDVRIWNVARTQQQIADDMNRELSGDETGLVGYWKLNEGTGNIAYDSAGNNNGTIYGATWTNGIIGDYQSPGTYTLTVPTTDLPDNVYLRYIVDTPDDTDIVAKYALSDSSDDNIESWIIANDGDIIGLDKNYLWVQFTLSTDDETVTPTIEALWLEEKDDKTVNMVEIDTGEIYLRNIGNGEEFDTLIDIGTSSTTTSNWAPYRVYYYKNKVQFIILASELEAKGITSGTIIDALSFKVSSKPSRNLNNFRIRIKETKDTTVTAWHTTDLTLAHYSQSIDHSLLTVGTVYKHEFNADITEWRYRGDNLLIEVSRDDTSGTNSGGMYLRTGLVANRMLTWNADSGASFPFDSVSGTAQSSVLETTISCINVEYADMGTYILVTSTASIPDLAPRLRFSTDEPDSTNINAEYACTDTNETEPDTWMAVDNEDILNLNNDYVWLRFTLETEDKTVTPILKSVWLEQANAPPDTIVLYFDSHNRFHDAEGKITVAYNQSLGSLSGERPVESFSEQFDPLDLEPTPIVSHTLTAGVDVSVDFIPLEYINGYTKSHTITAGVVKVEVEVIPLDMVDP